MTIVTSSAEVSRRASKYIQLFANIVSIRIGIGDNIFVNHFAFCDEIQIATITSKKYEKVPSYNPYISTSQYTNQPYQHQRNTQKLSKQQSQPIAKPLQYILHHHNLHQHIYVYIIADSTYSIDFDRFNRTRLILSISTDSISIDRINTLFTCF